MSFVKLGVNPGGAIDNGLIVTEHVILGHDRHTKVSEKISVFDGFLSGVTGCDEFGTVRGSLHSGLFLRDPFEWGMVDKRDNAGDGSPVEPVMVEIGVHIP